MSTIYLVVENDWESNVVLEAWTTEAKANESAEALMKARKSKPGPHSVWSIDVEEVELKQ
jgi:hypothetical protein